MEIGTKVKVSTPNLINYPLEGKVIQEAIDLHGLVMSKVKFSKNNEVWYADQNLITLSSEDLEKVLQT